jgi:hypothetical protein
MAKHYARGKCKLITKDETRRRNSTFLCPLPTRLTPWLTVYSGFSSIHAIAPELEGRFFQKALYFLEKAGGDRAVDDPMVGG